MSALRDLAREITSTSRLEVGRQFTTEDICELQNSAAIKFVDVDYVEYDRKDLDENDPQRHVSYSVWAVQVINKEDGETQEGFYRGGTTLNDIAVDILGTEGMLNDLRTEGLYVNLKVKKTKKGQNFTQVAIL